MNSSHLTKEVTEEQLSPYYDKVYFQADTVARYFIIGFFITGILLAFFHDTYLTALIMGGGTMVIFFIVQALWPETQLLRYVTSFMFWNFGLQYLLQMEGLNEMHFFFFIALTVLLFYEDWHLLIPATVYALITIIILYYLRDEEFVKTYMPLAQNTTTTSFAIHLLVILFYAGLCLRWSMMQREQTHESALRAIMMEQQLTLMETNIAFADNISQGNLRAEYPAEEADKLGHSLLNMRKSLTEVAAREEREKFATAGLASIGEILRQHADSLDLLCDRVIEEVVKYMKANQGAIFMLEAATSESKAQLKLMASRAWDRKKYIEKTIELGEGLVGQSAIEKRTIFMTKVPQNYITISSGLGSSNPGCVLIVPLKSDDELVGVIELASFKVFEEHEIKFLEKVGESIASTMISTQNNQRNKELLEKSNELAEQMRAQEEEIRQNLEEMQATQEEMQRKEKEINKLLIESQKNEELLKDKLVEIKQLEEADKLKTANMLKEVEATQLIMSKVIEELPEKIFLKDETGKMLLLNSALAAGYNKPVEQLLGKSDFDLFPHDLAAGYRKIEEEIIASDKPLAIYEDFPTSNGEVIHLYTVKMPFKFPGSDKVGLLGYQVDITEIKRMEKKVKEAELEILKKEQMALQEMKKYQQTLLNILDQLPHKIFLKDENGKMVLVNTVVAKAHNMSIDELIGKSDFDFVDAATAQQWRNQELEIIKKGLETYIFNEELSGKSITLKSTKMAFFIPHLNQTGLLGIQTDITELQKLKAEVEELQKKNS